MQQQSVSLFAPLPSNIVNQVTTYEQREQYVTKFLKNVLPSCDIKDIDEQLAKSYTFAKHKSKRKINKPKKCAFLTARKTALLGLNKFGKKSLCYSDMLPLNKMWLEYLQHALNLKTLNQIPAKPTNSNWENIGQKLMKADYHGAKVSVIRSKCPSVVGIEGIIIQDTKNTFRILGTDDVIRTVPKEPSQFRIKINNINVDVFGKDLCIRSAERSVKKIKNAHVPKL